jgi:murein DD-endopeptidase MepM/ murein hydrolase activator NlpD
MMKKYVLIIFLALLSTVIAWALLHGYTHTEGEELEVRACEDEDIPITVYGINVDTLKVHPGTVEPNEALSHILGEFGIGYPTLYKLIENTKDIYNPSRLRAGDPYTIVHTKEDKPRATQFIIEPSPKEYIVYHLQDSIYAEKVEREVQLVQESVTGRISSSVYTSMIQNGGSPQLVNRLVDVLAWQVDFFKIQEGDEFKVIYEEERVGGQPIGLKRILGVYFKHFNKEHYALYYDECGKGDYFDECGNSVRRAFLKAPLNYTRISSRYSPRRFHPILKTYRPHKGTDYAAPSGTPIRAVGSGVVTEARYGRGIGNFVAIRHNGTFTTKYYHMSGFAKGIRPGVAVSQGQTIGYVGMTGYATGPHVCFRFLKNGVEVDPFTVDMPPAKPIDPSELKGFMELRNSMVKRLDQLTIRVPRNEDNAQGTVGTMQ